MQEIYVENIPEVLKNKNIIKKQLKIKLTNRGKNIFIEGDAENEFLTINILEAVNLGFSIDRALLLKDENIILHTINIKDVTKRKDFYHIKSHLIGTHGKTLKTLNELSGCAISIQDKKVGIIGDSELIDEAILAVESLIHGSKWSNVYARLEREGKKRRKNPNSSKGIKNELKLKKDYI